MESTKELDGELAWFIGLIEGEGSFHVQRTGKWPRGRFSLKMSDQDVVESANNVLREWDIYLNVRSIRPAQLKKDGTPVKAVWEIQTVKATYLKTIIDKTYPFFSEKKQGDCDKVLKNLADRGLL